MLQSILLMATPEGGEASPIPNFLFLGGIILVFYFFMIRPQTKKAKEQKKFKESISKGDKIVTIGGIHGKIAELKDTTVIIETEGGNRLKVERSAISMEYSKGEQTNTSTQELAKNA